MAKVEGEGVGNAEVESSGVAGSGESAVEAETPAEFLHPSKIAQRMLHAFALLVDTQKGQIVRARCPGFQVPGLVQGTMSIERFDAFGTWGRNGAGFALEALESFEGLKDTAQLARWQLLGAHAAVHALQVYFLVRTLREAISLAATLDVRGIRCNRIFVVDLG